MTGKELVNGGFTSHYLDPLGSIHPLSS